MSKEYNQGNPNNNILLIGNGFDLHHNFKTSYADFMKFCKQPELSCIEGKEINNLIDKNSFMDYFMESYNENSTWIDLEKEIEIITRFFEEIFIKYDLNNGLIKFIKANDINYINFNDFVKMKNFKNILDTEIEYLSGYETYKINSKYRKSNIYDKNLILEDLRLMLENITKAIYLYLKNFSGINEKLEHLTKQIDRIKPNYVINFNYTDTIKLYGVPDENITYIHGNISDVNSMVLGTQETSDNFIYFCKYFQRLQKKCNTINYHKFTKYSNQGLLCNNVLHLYGHSLDITDGDIIKELIGKADKVIMYYREQSDYESKIINLFKIYNDKNKVISMFNSNFIESIEILND